MSERLADLFTSHRVPVLARANVGSLVPLLQKIAPRFTTEYNTFDVRFSGFVLNRRCHDLL